MNIIALFLVFIFAVGLGSFAAAGIFYPLFLTWPMLKKLNRQGKLTRFPAAQIFLPPLIWIVLTFLGYLLVNALAPGYVVIFWIVYVVVSLMIIGKTRSQQNLADFYESYKSIIKD